MDDEPKPLPRLLNEPSLGVPLKNTSPESSTPTVGSSTGAKDARATSSECHRWVLAATNVLHPASVRKPSGSVRHVGETEAVSML
eukprot:scaffold4105_cov63-Phaeocystis_antarctica.AAC.4